MRNNEKLQKKATRFRNLKTKNETTPHPFNYYSYCLIACIGAFFGDKGFLSVDF